MSSQIHGPSQSPEGSTYLCIKFQEINNETAARSQSPEGSSCLCDPAARSGIRNRRMSLNHPKALLVPATAARLSPGGLAHDVSITRRLFLSLRLDRNAAIAQPGDVSITRRLFLSLRRRGIGLIQNSDGGSQSPEGSSCPCNVAQVQEDMAAAGIAEVSITRRLFLSLQLCCADCQQTYHRKVSITRRLFLSLQLRWIFLLR